MKLLSNHTKITKFERLSSALSPRQLFRLAADIYSIFLLDRETKVFSFHSVIFSELISDIESEITDVTIAEHSDPERREDGPVGGFEIKLYLEGGEIVSIDEHDRVRLSLATTYGERQSETAIIPVREIWPLPNEYPFGHLHISEDLVMRLKPIIDDFGEKEVLRRLWFDYQNLTGGQNSRPPISCRVLVHGEFCSFRVTEHTCGRATLSI